MAVRNLVIRTLNEYERAVLNRISMKQETLGVGEGYFSDGREKLRFRRVDFDLCPNQILEKSLWDSFIIYKDLFIL